MAVHLKQFGYVCVQQEKCPWRKRKRRGYLVRASPWAEGSCVWGGAESAESSGPIRPGRWATKPTLKAACSPGWLHRGEPSENPGGDRNNSPGEEGGEGWGCSWGSEWLHRQNSRSRIGRGREEGKKGLSRVLQALREALRQCRCACVRACVCVCMFVWGRRRRRRRNRMGVWSSWADSRSIQARTPAPPLPRGGGGARWEISEAESDSGQKTVWPPSDTARSSLHCPTAPGREERTTGRISTKVRLRFTSDSPSEPSEHKRTFLCLHLLSEISWFKTCHVFTALYRHFHL